MVRQALFVPIMRLRRFNELLLSNHFMYYFHFVHQFRQFDFLFNFIFRISLLNLRSFLSIKCTARRLSRQTLSKWRNDGYARLLWVRVHILWTLRNVISYWVSMPYVVHGYKFTVIFFWLIDWLIDNRPLFSGRTYKHEYTMKYWRLCMLCCENFE